METTVEKICELVRNLPDHAQEEVLDLAKYLRAHHSREEGLGSSSQGIGISRTRTIGISHSYSWSSSENENEPSDDSSNEQGTES